MENQYGLKQWAFLEMNVPHQPPPPNANKVRVNPSFSHISPVVKNLQAISDLAYCLLDLA
jgi:hypothetical protein